LRITLDKKDPGNQKQAAAPAAEKKAAPRASPKAPPAEEKKPAEPEGGSLQGLSLVSLDEDEEDDE